MIGLATEKLPHLHLTELYLATVKNSSFTNICMWSDF